MTDRTDAAKARAEALFKRDPDTAQAGQDARSRASAETEKTARLRELRLAKERADQIAAEVRRTRRDLRRP